MKSNLKPLSGADRAGSRLAPFALVLACVAPTLALAQPAGQTTFNTAEQACAALVAAAASNDEHALNAILGPEGTRVVSSGDEVEDAASRATFVKEYQASHHLAPGPGGSTILFVGSGHWPTPIPLLERNASWSFDTEAGKQEILYRRIGQNEMATIRVCRERVASALALGYPKGGAGLEPPFYGYRYRTLVASRASARGQRDQGPRTFAFVAYPAVYRSSGVMTFIVDQDGIVYERDQGPKTVRLAKARKTFRPHPGWERAEALPEAAPAGPAF